MNQFDYSLPAQRIVFGAGGINQLGSLLEPCRWQRFLLCTSASQLRNGTIDSIQEALGGRLVAIYDNAVSHVPEAQVDEALALAKQHQADTIIGLGGGSPIGLAKAVDYALGREHEDADNAKTATIAIPTTYAGSEMTPVFGVTRTQPDGSTRKETVREDRIAPALVLYDPALTLNLPTEITAATGINALAHCVEAVYSITRNPLSTAAALQGIRYIVDSLPRCCNNGQDLDARTSMMIGAHLGGAALASVKMGIHHGTCHVLGGTAGLSHGVANAIMLPHAMRYNQELMTDELALVADVLDIDRAGLSTDERIVQAIERISEMIGQLGLPQRLRETDMSREMLPLIAENMLKSRSVLDNPKPLADVESAMALLRAAW